MKPRIWNQPGMRYSISGPVDQYSVHTAFYNSQAGLVKYPGQLSYVQRN
mgnify:CR=1 FL=1